MASANQLTYSSNSADLEDCGIFIITVPTPIDKANRPDLNPLKKASETVGRVMKQGAIVIYESTVYPGCTEEVCVPVLEEHSGLKFNQDFFCGYSPERIVPGDKVKIKLAPKGAGSENKSAVKMMVPADGVAGVKKFVVEVVKNAGSNSCPPMVVGVGIGGTMEMAAICAKRAAARDITTRNSDERYAELEDEMLTLINKTGIGPQGLGGLTTALKVNIEWYPTHIASLPVAVNINCHAARHAEVEL